MPGEVEVKVILTVVHRGSFVSEVFLRQNVDLQGTARRFRTVVPVLIDLPDGEDNVYEVDEFHRPREVRRAILIPNEEETRRQAERARRRADREPYWRLEEGLRPDRGVREVADSTARLRSRSRDEQQQ